MFSCELSILLSTECPPILFEMSYFENGVQIGGNPWHYIYTPNHKRHIGTHHICSFTDGALVNTLRYSLENHSYKKSQAAIYLVLTCSVSVCFTCKFARPMVLGVSLMLFIKLLHSKSMNVVRLWY